MRLLRRKNQIEQDEIAARQLHALEQHYAGRLRLTGVKEMFAGLSEIGFQIGQGLQGRGTMASAAARSAGTR